jgi:hypothetical protein
MPAEWKSVALFDAIRQIGDLAAFDMSALSLALESEFGNMTLNVDALVHKLEGLQELIRARSSAPNPSPRCAPA